jgi:hypothetical protein
MSIISWQEQFVIKIIGTSGIFKDKKLKAGDYVFLNNIVVTPNLRPMVRDVIIVIDEKV